MPVLLIDSLYVLLSLAVILAAAELFTNAVEWLGAKLKLSEGAVGSVLAAVGTAMPETLGSCRLFCELWIRLGPPTAPNTEKYNLRCSCQTNH